MDMGMDEREGNWRDDRGHTRSTLLHVFVTLILLITLIAATPWSNDVLQVHAHMQTVVDASASSIRSPSSPPTAPSAPSSSSSSPSPSGVLSAEAELAAAKAQLAQTEEQQRLVEAQQTTQQQHQPQQVKEDAAAAMLTTQSSASSSSSSSSSSSASSSPSSSASASSSPSSLPSAPPEGMPNYSLGESASTIESNVRLDADTDTDTHPATSAIESESASASEHESSSSYDDDELASMPAPTRRMITDLYEQEVDEQRAAWERNEREIRALDEEWGEVPLPDCPLDATFQQLRRFGHRLWYEGDMLLARACMEKAADIYLHPNNAQTTPDSIASKREKTPSEHPRFDNIFIETRGMVEQEFEDFGHVVDLIQQRSERLYSLPWQGVRPRLHAAMKAVGALTYNPHISHMAKKVNEKRMKMEKKRWAQELLAKQRKNRKKK